MRSKTCHGLWVMAALSLLTTSAWAEIQPQGPEFRVSILYSGSSARNPVVAFTPAGGAIVVWENDQSGLHSFSYDAHGLPTGFQTSLVANQGFTGLPFAGTIMSRREPAVAFLPNGEFLLAWTEEVAFVSSAVFIERRDVQDQDVYVQRFSAAGAPLSGRMRINSTTAGFQHTPQLIFRAGSFLAVWEDAWGIVGRVLNSLGQPFGAEIRISATNGRRPALAANSQGRVLVVWDAADEDQLGVFARLFDAAANPLGPEFRVNTDTAYRQARPAVAADRRTGGFFVAWQSEHPEFWTGFYYLYGQVVGAGGNLVGPQVRLYSGPLAANRPQIAPALAATGLGRFLLTWLTWESTVSMDLAGVELDVLGAPLGEAFWVSERKVNAPFREIAAATNGEGNFFIVWEASENRTEVGVRRLEVQFVFKDGLESGDVGAWGWSTP